VQLAVALREHAVKSKLPECCKSKPEEGALSKDASVRCRDSAPKFLGQMGDAGVR